MNSNPAEIILPAFGLGTARDEESLGSNPTGPATIWVFNYDTMNSDGVQTLQVEPLVVFLDAIRSPNPNLYFIYSRSRVSR